jgi:hypothetical protein
VDAAKDQVAKSVAGSAETLKAAETALAAAKSSHDLSKTATEAAVDVAKKAENKYQDLLELFAYKLKKDTPRHRQGGASSNFQIVNCFTGFGRASVYELNKPTAALPNFADCIPHLEKAFPDFTLAKLKSAVENATK